jgi:phosphate transport system substrate-binding protein
MVSLGFSTLLGCGGGEWGGRSLVSMDGSSTVYPIAEAISEEFQLENPRVMVIPGRSGTGGGFERFCRGETDISTASRQILESEAIECELQGVRYLELPVAFDGLSVIVSRQNEFVECLTVEELGRIWRPGSRVRTWRDVRPEFPGAELQLFGPGTDSGTYDTFTQAIVGEVGASRTDFQASEDDNMLVQGISGDRYALGFFGYAYLAGNRERLNVVAVDGGMGCVNPSQETILDGTYTPLSRPLYLYVKLSSLKKEGLRNFLDYFMVHARELIPPTGFVPVSEGRYRDNLAAVTWAAARLDPIGVDSEAEGSPGG